MSRRTEGRVLVSVTVTRPEERLIVKALHHRGVHAEIVNRRNIAYYLNHNGSPHTTAALVRNVSHRELRDYSARFECAGVRTLNSSFSARVCTGKDMQLNVFGRAEIPTPRTFAAFCMADVAKYVEELGGSAVIKPASGSWGRGVVRVTGAADLAAWQGGWESTDPEARGMAVVVQEYVPKSGFDIRVIVIGERPVLAFRRISDQWRTNTSLGADVQPMDMTVDMNELCTSVVRCLGPGIYGIDLVQTRETGELRVLEVNANPEFARSSAKHGVDIAAAIAGYVHEVLVDEPVDDLVGASLGGPRGTDPDWVGEDSTGG